MTVGPMCWAEHPVRSSEWQSRQFLVDRKQEQTRTEARTRKLQEVIPSDLLPPAMYSFLMSPEPPRTVPPAWDVGPNT